MNIGNLKIGSRLGLAFGLMLLMLIASTLFGMASLKSLNEGTNYIVNDKYPKAVYAFEIRGIVNSNARYMRNMLLLNDPAEMEKERQNLLRNKQKNSENFSALEKLVKSDQGKALLKNVLVAKAQYGLSQQEFLKLIEAGKKDEATALLFSTLGKDQQNYFESLEELIRHQTAGVSDSVKLAENTYQHTLLMLSGLAVFALVFGCGVAIWITRSITVPLREAVNVAHTVAAGDLRSKIEVNGNDETGLLLQALKEMNDSLVGMVTEVRSGADTIATASAQITSGNLDLSSRTEQQAGSLEETASSMEELTGTVKQNADNAREANGLVVSASEVAVKGGEVVSQVVGTMISINESARKIVDIIGVIDGIAFQTNILALNAAVEAARAGEQGRGFAVVAAEVRNLAQRSAAAAKEIKLLINDSVEKVETGSKLVDQAGATMKEIVTSVRHVTDIMNEITTASQEQTTGIEQVNEAINHMDQATQQNAALVEEAAAAAASMQEQAGNLVQMVSVFKLADFQSTKSTHTTVAKVLPITAARVGSSHKNDGAPSTRIKRITRASAANTNAKPAISADGWEEF